MHMYILHTLWFTHYSSSNLSCLHVDMFLHREFMEHFCLDFPKIYLDICKCAELHLNTPLMFTFTVVLYAYNYAKKAVSQKAN